MPAIEARMRQIVFFRDWVLVERLVVRMLEFDVFQSLILRDKTIADDLHLRLMRDCLEVWMQDALFGIKRLAVAVAARGRVESLGQLILSLRCATTLIFENDDGMLVEGIGNLSELSVYTRYQHEI